jgi:O-acetyl-ADP-ribose deacetylase (regulator of RNase III)
MGKEIIGSLLDVKEGILVHGCNAQGVMGSGIAKAIKDTYPQAFAAYRETYEKEGLHVGQVIWARISETPRLAVANAITQKFYGRDPTVRYVDYDAVKVAFEKIAVVAKKHGLTVHYPRIGAGLGNGDWSVLSGIINQALAGVEHTLCVPENEANPPAPAPRSGRRP